MAYDVVEEGSLGFFWPVTGRCPDFDVDPERGYVKCQERWAHIDVLEEDAEAAWMADDNDPPPCAIVAVLPEDAVVFLEIRGRYGTRRMGVRASSAWYDARTVVGGLDVMRLRRCEPRSLRPYFHGIGSWAGLTAVEETTSFHPDHRISGMTINLTGVTDQTAALTRGRSLTVSATWAVSGPHDKRIVNAPVSIACTAPSPRRTWDLLQPLLLTQDLINFAYGGFVAAVPGTADMDLEPGREKLDPTPWMWNGALMVSPPGALQPPKNNWPMFDLADIDGVDGLARWANLAAKHPRAVTPITQWYRSGGQSSHAALREIATAIEYWVRATGGAASRGRRVRLVDRLAARVGRPFKAWVGDPQAWAEQFWESNNRLKHEPTFDSDDLELADLATAGRYLLAAALLNRVARSTVPAERIFGNHRINSVGRRLQQLVV
jgi:hypothetical protein